MRIKFQQKLIIGIIQQTAEPIELKPKQTYNTYTTESYTFTKEEEAKEQQQAPEYTKKCGALFQREQAKMARISR